MRIEVTYGATQYSVKDSQENRETLSRIAQIVINNSTKALEMELLGGGALVIVVGPGIPLSVVYFG